MGVDHSGMLLALALNSFIFSALAFRYLYVLNSGSWPGMVAAMRREWASALIMALLGFLILVPIVVIILLDCFHGSTRTVIPDHRPLLDRRPAPSPSDHKGLT